MKRKKQFLLSAGVITVLLCAAAVTVLASSMQKQITISYNNIKIYVDGSQFTPNDANGNVLEPFIYNGTTYLPVRAVSEALGNSITWDGGDSSVYIKSGKPSPQLTSSAESGLSAAPAGHISPDGQVTAISDGLTGMLWFYCFNGCIYQIVSDDYANIYVYDKSDLSAEPIGSVYNPLYPSDNTDLFGAVYNVDNMPNAAGTYVPKSIAIKSTPYLPTGYKDYYERADYFASDVVSYNGQTYQIAPTILPSGRLGTETPYDVDKKVGVTANGYDVYSYKNPPYPGVLAVDIPGMTFNLGTSQYYHPLYAMAIPTTAITSKISSVIMNPSPIPLPTTLPTPTPSPAPTAAPVNTDFSEEQANAYDYPTLVGVTMKTELKYYAEGTQRLLVNWENDTDNSLMFGEPWQLEKFDDKKNKWITVYNNKSLVGFYLEGIMLGPRQGLKHTYLITAFDEDIKKGLYRAVTSFTYLNSTEQNADRKTFSLAAEFTITDDQSLIKPSELDYNNLENSKLVYSDADPNHVPVYVYKDKKTYDTTTVINGEPYKIGEGTGKWGVVYCSPYINGDNKYLVYSYSRGNEKHYSYIGVFSINLKKEIYRSEVFEGYDITVNYREGNYFEVSSMEYEEYEQGGYSGSLIKSIGTLRYTDGKFVFTSATGG